MMTEKMMFINKYEGAACTIYSYVDLYLCVCLSSICMYAFLYEVRMLYACLYLHYYLSSTLMTYVVVCTCCTHHVCMDVSTMCLLLLCTLGFPTHYHLYGA